MNERESFRRTKIIATLGPATDSPEAIRELIAAGVNVTRLNMSHAPHDWVRKVVADIRVAAKELGRHVGILMDTQGPAIRTGDLPVPLDLQPGQKFTLTVRGETSEEEHSVDVNYENFVNDINVGDVVLVDNGEIHMKVLGKEAHHVECEVLTPGTLKSRRHINLPGVKVSLPALTSKDLDDVSLGLELGVDFVALSFCREAKDLQQLRAVLQKGGPPPLIVAKIEDQQAVRNLDEIVNEADAVMVARGDLGIECPYEELPVIQRRIVKACLLKGRPVIVATHMLESMIESQSPSRAEVNDVANSVCDGADAVMLSGETSVGKFPVKVVETMASIVAHVESTFDVKPITENPPSIRNERFITKTICYNAAKIADQVGAAAILTLTFSGYTALKIAGHRPRTKIVVFTANYQIMNQMSLVWGVEAFYYDGMESTDQSFDDIKTILKENKVVEENDLIVKIASMPIEEKGFTNMLKISAV